MVWLKGTEEATYCVIDTVLSNEDTVGSNSKDHQSDFMSFNLLRKRQFSTQILNMLQNRNFCSKLSNVRTTNMELVDRPEKQ